MSSTNKIVTAAVLVGSHVVDTEAIPVARQLGVGNEAAFLQDTTGTIPNNEVKEPEIQLTTPNKEVKEKAATTPNNKVKDQKVEVESNQNKKPKRRKLRRGQNEKEEKAAKAADQKVEVEEATKAEGMIADILKRDDYYGILDLKPNANAEDIKNAYKKRAQQVHPDHNKQNIDANKAFQKLKHAHDELMKRFTVQDKPSSPTDHEMEEMYNVVSDWIKTPTNKKKFEEYVKSKLHSSSDLPLEELWNELLILEEKEELYNYVFDELMREQKEKEKLMREQKEKEILFRQRNSDGLDKVWKTMDDASKSKFCSNKEVFESAYQTWIGQEIRKLINENKFEDAGKLVDSSTNSTMTPHEQVEWQVEWHETIKAIESLTKCIKEHKQLIQPEEKAIEKHEQRIKKHKHLIEKHEQLSEEHKQRIKTIRDLQKNIEENKLKRSQLQNEIGKAKIDVEQSLKRVQRVQGTSNLAAAENPEAKQSEAKKKRKEEARNYINEWLEDETNQDKTFDQFWSENSQSLPDVGFNKKEWKSMFLKEQLKLQQHLLDMLKKLEKETTEKLKNDKKELRKETLKVYNLLNKLEKETTEKLKNDKKELSQETLKVYNLMKMTET